MQLRAGDPETIGGYRLRARLGAGGMGTVFLAQTPSGRPVAIKLIHQQFLDDEEFRTRFRQEVAAARRVSGAFTAAVVDADPEGEHPWMATSLDRRVVGEKALVEIKTARFPTDEWGRQGTSEIPTHYIVQCQHELAVTGAETCYVAVLFAGSEPRLYVVGRDDELIATLIELEAEFMACVRSGTP